VLHTAALNGVKKNFKFEHASASEKNLNYIDDDFSLDQRDGLMKVKIP
jgi:hypothetical protein